MGKGNGVDTMNLETIIAPIQEKAHEIEKKIPWYARFLYKNEIQGIQQDKRTGQRIAARFLAGDLPRWVAQRTDKRCLL